MHKMSQYGKVLNPDFNPRRRKIYSLFVEYFQNPIMTKIKDVDKYSMYGFKNSAILGIEYRYVFVFVYRDDDKVGSKYPLSKLQWLGLQTRTVPDIHNIPVHNYIPRRLEGLDEKISLVHKDANQYVYDVQNLPLKITLLPKKDENEYSPNGSVVVALETYQTIVTFTD